MENKLKVCFLIFTLFLSVLSCTSTTSHLTEESVKDKISEIDDAIVNIDLDRLAEFISDDATIVFSVNMGGKKQVVKPSKAEYIAQLKQGMAQVSDYTYRRSNVSISFDGDRATVRSVVDETMTMQGRGMNSQSDEEFTIELIDENMIVTNLKVSTIIN